jgi:bacterioferritin-associated ferredoxin
MYVCLCNAITEKEVRQAVQLGASSLKHLREGLGVAACCGSCADCAKKIIREKKKNGACMSSSMQFNPA